MSRSQLELADKGAAPALAAARNQTAKKNSVGPAMSPRQGILEHPDAEILEPARNARTTT
jgi:hypothetical protein